MRDVRCYTQTHRPSLDDVCVSSVSVQSSQCMWLMQALGFLLSALPEEEVLVRLHALITPHIQQLETLVQQEV